MGEIKIKIADVRALVALSLHDEFEAFTTLKPRLRQETAVSAMLDDLIAWGKALQAIRMSGT